MTRQFRLFFPVAMALTSALPGPVVAGGPAVLAAAAPYVPSLDPIPSEERTTAGAGSDIEPLAVAPDPGSGGCTNYGVRVGAKGHHGVDPDIDGVAGTVQVPTSFPGIQPGRVVASDVYVHPPAGASKDFVQAGWMVGNASQLPYSTTPRAFFGEYAPGETNNEILSAPVTLTPGAYYTFSIRRNHTTGRYHGFVNGVQRWISQRTHANMLPAVTSETSNTCVTMDGRWRAATTTNGSLRSLQFHRQSTGRYYGWAEQHDYNDRTYYYCHAYARYNNNETGTARQYTKSTC